MFDDIENSIYAGDGRRQAEESPLAGYRVELYKADDTDNAIASTTTGADGKYSFANIEPGSYVVGVKTTTMDGVEYLLPLFWLDGTTGDNRFVATQEDPADENSPYTYAYTAPITVAKDSEITGMDAGMRTVPGIQPMAATIINLSTVASSGTGYTYASNVVTITTSGEYELTGTTARVRVIIATGVTADITLNGVNMTNGNGTTSRSPIQLQNGANVNLTLAAGTTNVLRCDYAISVVVGTTTLYADGTAGLYVRPNATLTIDGTGTLNASGGIHGAGIGGTTANHGYINTNSNAGTITINSGTVTAVGGTWAAAIGGGCGGSGGTITINGGTVTATGTTAGIGGGGGGSGGVININGGIVTASAMSCSPGIGGGGYVVAGLSFTSAGDAGTIIITGGRVTATGSNYSGTVIYAGGIGGALTNTGVRNTSGTIIITGGSIYPTNYIGTVSVYPTPTNGSNGAPDPVGMLTFPGYSSGEAFSIIAGGTVSSYLYEANAHPDGNVYAWLAYPGVSTEAATNVTANSATLNGTYYMNGTTISSAYFEYGTSTGYGNTKTLTTPTNVTSGVIESVSDNLTGLTSNTTYHYRLVITVGSITIYGNDVTFTTLVVPPDVTASHNVTGGMTATLNGTYNLNGGTFTSGYFEIYDGTSWITPTNTSAISITSATGVTASTGQVDNSTTTPSISISGLTPGTTYQYRFTITTNGGTDTATGSFIVGYAVTEKFVNLNGSAVDSTGLPDNTVYVTGSYTASGIPTSHTAGGNTYTYIGYKLDSYTTGDSLTSGTPSSVTITGNRDVYYVYAIAEGSIKIEKYAHDGTTLLPGAEFKLEKLTGPGGSVTSIVGSMTTGAGGSVTFVNLSAGSYRITETKAPTGYELLTAAFEVDMPKDITYAVGTPPADSSYLYSTTSGGNVIYHYYDVTYKVSDQASIAMPSAGATGNFPPYALWGGGIILLAALGGGILWLKRRRAYAPKHG